MFSYFCRNAALFCGLATAAWAQVTPNSLITKLPMAHWIFQADGALGTDAPLYQISSLGKDPSGNIIFADPGNKVVLRLNADGTVTVLAGNGVQGYSGDGGPALSASLTNPTDAVMDSQGNLYIYDSGVIRRIGNNIRVNNQKIITTFVTGIGTRLALDAAGNLYVAGSDCQIKRVASDGSVSVFAGTGMCGHSGDGQMATQANISPGGMAFDKAGNLYFVENVFLAEKVIGYVRKIATDATISTIAGNGTTGFSSNEGPALSTPLNFPHSIAVDPDGNVFVSEDNNEIIRRITPDGVTSVVAGSGPTRYGFTGDGGPATQATFLFPRGLALDSAGNLYVADSGNFRIRRIQAGVIGTVAGNGQFRSVPDGTPSNQAFLYGPADIAFDLSDNLLISEFSFAKVTRIMSQDDAFQVLAGIGRVGRGGEDGPANQALLDIPRQLATDVQGNVYITDSGASVIYKVTDGRLVKFAGKEAFSTGYDGDNGPALNATFNQPFGIAVDPLGNVFVADTYNHVIRKIGSDGMITRYAGNGNPGYSGDNGPANAARLYYPTGLAIDAGGNVLICDYDNHRIRSVSPAGTISTIAGNGMASTAGDGGPASQASLLLPLAIAVDIDGGIFVVTTSSVKTGSGTLLRRIDTSGIISTIAGDGLTFADQGDGGPAGTALLDAKGVAVDSSGNVFLSSFSGDAIRVILNFEPFLHLSQESFSDLPVTSVSVPAAVSGGAASAPQLFAVSSDFTGVLFTATADRTWIKLPKSQGSTPSTMVFLADPSTLSPGSYVGHIKLTRAGATVPFATVTVRFPVMASIPPKLSVQPLNLTLSAAKGSTTQQTQTIYISNTGSGQLSYQLSELGLPSGALFVDDPSTSGTVDAGKPHSIKIAVDPSKLSLGAFVGTLLVKSSTSNETQSVPVAISITSKPQRMVLSQRGFTFTAVQGGGVTPPQSFAVVNSGGGSFDWTAQAMTVGDGPAWLSISPLAGTSTAGSTPPSISVKADPTALASPAVYYGIVRVSSQNAADAPQDVEIVLNLLPANTNAEPVVSRTALIFVGPAGASSPSSQTITITNLNSAPVGVSPSASTIVGTPWLIVAPDTPQQQIAAGGSLKLVVATNVIGLQPGLYQGTLTLGIPSPLSNLYVDVRLIVTGGGGSNTVTGESASVRDAAGCPSQLVAVFTSLSDNFNARAAYPNSLDATVVDDCGTPFTAGAVVASFTNGDAPIPLVPLGDGRWQGTWSGASVNAGPLKITLRADSNSTPPLTGTQFYNGTLLANSYAPAINPGGVSGAAGTATQTVGAGSIISIRGNSFAQSSTSATLPLIGVNLAGNKVTLAGVSLPILYTSGVLINALVPYDAQPGQYVARVEHDKATSFPEPVVIGSAQPSILRVTTSASQGVAQDLWTQLLAGNTIDASTIAPNTLHVGDTITVYCTGLGAVTPPIPDPTQPAPSPARNVQNPVTLTIGVTNVPVASATLVSGFAGIYAVQATIPGGILDGMLVVSVASQPSQPVAVSVR